MHSFRRLVVGCLVIGLATVAYGGELNAKLMDEVAAIGDALAKAMVKDDYEFMLGMYAEDAISLPNYGPRMEGIEAFKKHHAEMTAAGMKILAFDSEPTEAWGCGDQVIEIGWFEIALEMPGMPDSIKDKGKYMTVYSRDADGMLKIKAETWNTDLNPMEMAAGEHDH
jgi:ketosteroid isomerase-like protein